MASAAASLTCGITKNPAQTFRVEIGLVQEICGAGRHRLLICDWPIRSGQNDHRNIATDSFQFLHEIDAGLSPYPKVDQTDMDLSVEQCAQAGIVITLAKKFNLDIMDLGDDVSNEVMVLVVILDE
ncbi:MAG: hypothetical protein AAF543_04840 [Pseudomonadota bacterium]